MGRSLFASARLGPETPPVRTRAGGIQVQDRGRGNAEQCPGPEGAGMEGAGTEGAGTDGAGKEGTGIEGQV